MIRFDSDDGHRRIIIEIRNRYTVYLDNDSMIELAKGELARRQRFVTAIRRGGSLLFSLTNAVEIGGTQGASAALVNSFLDALGAHWAPLELNPWRVMEKERASQGEFAPISETFVLAHFMQRVHDLSSDGDVPVNLSEDFFRLSAVADWSRQYRSELMRSVDHLYSEFRKQLAGARGEYECSASLQSRRPVPFDKSCPATFATTNLMRMLVAEWKAYQFTRNDVMDFCHAVLGTSAATLATLDKQWKGRVERLPKPNGLAKVFYRTEVDQLVDLLGTLVDNLPDSF